MAPGACIQLLSYDKEKHIRKQEEYAMDYRHLKYFMEVAEQKSFSKAARNLHISQSAISRMIKSLEEELGVTALYQKCRRTVEITALEPSS